MRNRQSGRYGEAELHRRRRRRRRRQANAGMVAPMTMPARDGPTKAGDLADAHHQRIAGLKVVLADDAAARCCSRPAPSKSRHHAEARAQRQSTIQISIAPANTAQSAISAVSTSRTRSAMSIRRRGDSRSLMAPADQHETGARQALERQDDAEHDRIAGQSAAPARALRSGRTGRRAATATYPRTAV